MKKLLFLFLALCVTTSAMAFSFDVAGVHETRYRYFSRTGPGDLYGNVIAAQSPTGAGQTTIGFSGPVFRSVVPEGFSSKGSDFGVFEQRFIFRPNIIVNQAVRVKSEISFQGSPNGPYTGGPNWLNVPHYGEWYRLTARPPDGMNVIAAPVLRTAYVRADLPWGTFRAGRQPYTFGIGWSGFHGLDFRPAMLSLTVPYGPISTGVGVVFASTDEWTDPGDTRNANLTAFTVASANDRNEQKAIDLFAWVQYLNGPLDMGFLGRFETWNKVHATPFTSWTLRDDVSGAALAVLSQGIVSGGAGQNGTTVQGFPLHSDISLYTLVMYAKYSTGHFFANGEIALQDLSVTRLGGRAVSGNPLAWYIDMGTIYGPMKMTFVGAWSSGHTRTGGRLDFAAATGNAYARPISDKFNLFTVPGGRWHVLDPYGFVIAMYGGGNNAYDQSGNVTYLDFFGLGGRVDYAFASNLNAYATYLYAKRASNSGYGWGAFNGGIGGVPEFSPNVSDNLIGDEWNVGLRWAWLENLSLNVRFGRWRPGKWFAFAYQDLSTTTGIANPLSTNGQDTIMINPDRDLSPIIGLEGSVLIEF